MTVTPEQSDSLKTVGASPVPVALVSVAAFGAAAYVWHDFPVYRVFVVPVLLGGGVIAGLLAAWLAGKRAAFNASERRVEAFEYSSAAVLLSDADGHVVHKNRAAEALLEKLKTGSDGSRILQKLCLDAQPGQQAGFIRLEGKVIRWRARIPGDEAGRVWQLDDVTEIARGHTQIQHDLNDLEDIFDLMPVGFLSADNDGWIGRCNATLGQWLGVDPEQMKGRRFKRIHDRRT